jgi:hypothetical protein
MSHVCSCFVVVVATTAVLAAPQTTSVEVSIVELMSAAEFREAGLAKLSPQELVSLNRWLGKYAAAVASSVKQPDSQVGSPQVIESYISGDFRGWNGETIFEFDNGQIWQQVSVATLTATRTHPKVVIFRSGGAFRMKVDGVTGDIAVKRLR